jgi:myo-inositol 2-dehydrogenase / D-chiro-inositol 1-dehydrogenase
MSDTAEHNPVEQERTDSGTASNPSPIRYGLIGCGLMGCEHARNLAALPGAIVTAIADPHEPSRTSARIALGDAALDLAEFNDVQALLASGLVDAVVISTPNFTHIDVLRECFEYPELHILIEKPLCTTVADAQEIVRRSGTHRGVVWMGLEYRYMPPVAKFLSLIRETVGALKMVAIREHRFPFLIKVGDWNRFTINTGGTLVEKCCHFFDLMNLANRGSRPVRVFASGGQDVNHLDERYPGNPAGETPDILDNAYVTVEYDNGVRAMLDLCMFAEAGSNEQELCAVGSSGKVEAYVPEGRVVVGRRMGIHPDGDGRPKTPQVLTIDAAHDDRVQWTGYHHGASYLEHVDFASAIRNGTPPLVTVEEGLWSVAIGVAAHESIATGQPVTLPSL